MGLFFGPKSAMEVLLIACIHRVGTTNSHVRGYHPSPSWFSPQGEAVAEGEPLSKGSSSILNLVPRAQSDVRRSANTAPYHVSRSLCIASFHPYPIDWRTAPPYPNPPHPSFQAHVAADVIFGRFIDVSSWRYPPMDVAFRMFLIMKSGRRHNSVERLRLMLAIIFFAALGQPSKFISGCTWSPLQTHSPDRGLLETPNLPGSTWIHMHTRANT